MVDLRFIRKTDADCDCLTALSIFLCTWSIICINLPAPDTPYYMMWWRRAWMTSVGLIAPEVMFGFAIVQYCSARRSVRAFEDSGYDNWSLMHAFFADAGGFILHTADYPPFPVTGLQLHYLITHDYIAMPQLSKKHISDRNKVDGMLRFLSLWQVFWFCLNEFFRFISGLHISALELTTVANIIITVPSAICWYSKPQDVTMPEVIYSDTSIAQVILESRCPKAGGFYRYSPLDFVDRAEWSWSKQWCHYTNILRHILRPFRLDHWFPHTVPVTRIQTTYVPALSAPLYLVLSLVSLTYMSMFILGWNHTFPTAIEQQLWRCASLTSLVMAFCCLFFEFLGWNWWPTWRQRLLEYPAYRRWRAKMEWRPPRRKWAKKAHEVFGRVKSACRNNTIDQDPEMDVPLKVQLPLYLIGFTYCVTRAVMATLDFIELRSMPASAYQKVSWMNLLPFM